MNRAVVAALADTIKLVRIAHEAIENRVTA
jgi:hypothetical protein